MTYNILVVDDEKNIREGLGKVLEMDGYKVLLACDGKEAIQKLDRGDIDLVITDLKMPNLSGEEVLQKATSMTGICR